VEVLEDGFRMFLNLDLRLKERGLVVAGLLEVVGWVVALSLEELSSRVLDLNKEETGFREKDRVVGLGEVVVGGEDSSEVGFSCASLSGSAGCSLRLLASLEKRELSEASEREAEEPRGETEDTEGAGLGSRSVFDL